jgi:hypothetical protein
MLDFLDLSQAFHVFCFPVIERMCMFGGFGGGSYFNHLNFGCLCGCCGFPLWFILFPFDVCLLYWFRWFTGSVGLFFCLFVWCLLVLFV